MHGLDVNRLLARAGLTEHLGGSLTKLYWSECHQAFAALALQLVAPIHPGHSALAQRAKAHFSNAYLFSRAESIYAGTTEVQLDVIAQRIQKLTKD